MAKQPNGFKIFKKNYNHRKENSTNKGYRHSINNNGENYMKLKI